MLKIFIPLNVLEDYGPLKVYNKVSSRLVRKNNLQNLKSNLITGKGEFIYGVNPNVCFHEELNPRKELTCKQIMFQLNPAYECSYPSNLYQRQFNGEVKFTSFNSIFNKMIPFD